MGGKDRTCVRQDNRSHSRCVKAETGAGMERLAKLLDWLGEQRPEELTVSLQHREAGVDTTRARRCRELPQTFTSEARRGVACRTKPPSAEVSMPALTAGGRALSSPPSCLPNAS